MTARGLRHGIRDALLVLGLLGALSACGAPSSATNAPVAYRATDLQSESGVSLADLRGRPALLTSWAVWCTACREELPALEVFWATHHDVQIVAVNLDGSRQQAIRMVKSIGLTMPVWHDPGDAFSKVFRLLGVPSWVIVGADGSIVREGPGPVDVQDAALLGALTGSQPVETAP
ncbi:MAG TPA: TlpA disulfide reductase family protein [Vicinamibacteria bacterium]|nr:TlpA disulfide reductase family protein [Vicinamibacteria bacterium]